MELGKSTFFPVKAKDKEFLYSASYRDETWPAMLCSHGSGSWSVRANGAAALMRPSTTSANEQLDPWQQLSNTPPPQSTTSGFHPLQHSPLTRWRHQSGHPIAAYLSTWKDERLSWPSWLACSGRLQT